MNFFEKADHSKLVVGIIGLGYVGLPLSRAFAYKKIKVIGFDINLNQINMLNKNKSYIKHIANSDIKKMRSEFGFVCTTDYSKISEVDAIIICVPTPLTKSDKPDLKPIYNTANSIVPHLKQNQIVILESSTYPGTTQEELGEILEKSKLKRDEDFFLAYSPEREDPGNKDFSTTTIPKIVGADSEKALKMAEKLYSIIIEKVISVSSTKVAEAVKLTENIFRSVNIALVNELKVIFDSMDIDIWEVIDGASSKPFGFMPHYPGPGLGGHCIPIDPFYLRHKAKEFNIDTQFIELASQINRDMPNYVLSKIKEALIKNKKTIKKSKILLLGLSYKKNVDDMRESPSLKLIEIITKNGMYVDFHDDYIKVIPENRDYSHLVGKKSVNLNANNLSKYDLILLSTDHSYLDLNLIYRNSSLIVDTRNAFKAFKDSKKIIKA